MRFSVIIPLYNKALYVLKALESVFNQTFNDYELVVVDDGSRDDSFRVAQEKLMHAPVRYRLVHQENAGVSTARNRGVSLSHGEYICFLDADDWWEPSYLEAMDSLIKDFPDAGLYGTSYRVVDNKAHKTRDASIGVEQGFQRGYIDYFKVYSTGFYMPIWTGAACVPRRVFDAVHGFNPVLKMSEDFDLWVRIAMENKVALLNAPLSNYNQDVNAATRAIGALPPPETQFAFCADYLRQAKERDGELKYTVEMVQIVCLRDYYLSRAYHSRAKDVLATLDIDAHRAEPYAKYLFRPYWSVLLKERLYGVLNRWMRR